MIFETYYGMSFIPNIRDMTQQGGNKQLLFAAGISARHHGPGLYGGMKSPARTCRHLWT